MGWMNVRCSETYARNCNWVIGFHDPESPFKVIRQALKGSRLVHLAMTYCHLRCSAAVDLIKSTSEHVS